MGRKVEEENQILSCSRKEPEWEEERGGGGGKSERLERRMCVPVDK